MKRGDGVGIGVDFGTSNSTVAWFDGTTLRCVAVEASSAILPTAIHLSREFVGSTGSEAIDRYVEENTARLVHLGARDSRSGILRHRRSQHGDRHDGAVRPRATSSSAR
jgi:molecular chaperone DnaK (HSP70)